MRIRPSLVLMFPVLLAGLSGQVVHNRYVSLSGSDSNAGTQSSPWRTITHAAKTSPTGTAMHIGPGTFGTAGFLEGIEITGGKGLVFRGAGQGKTIIKAHAGFSKAIPVRSGTQTWTAVFIVRDFRTNASIFDLTIDASQVSASRVATIIYTDAGEGKLIRTELLGAGAAVTNSEQDHVGLLAVGKDNSNASKVRLSKCYVHGFNKTGIRMYGGGLTGVIEFCKVQGAGLVSGTAVAQDAIHLGPGGRKYTVNNSVIRDVWHDSATKNAEGIRIDNSLCATQILNNQVLCCETGISHVRPSIGTTTIEANNVANCDVALRVLSDGATATDNDFDAQTGVVAASGIAFPMSGNSYSDFRRNFGYPTKYVVPNNVVIKDIAPRLSSRGFAGPVDVTQGSGSRSNGIVTGDFDGDGTLDFAVANFGANLVRVHFGSGGTNYTTKLPRELRVAGGPLFLTAGEFSGAAGLDLVIVTATGKVFLFGNRGTGWFTNTSSLTIPALGRPTSIASGDIDQKDETDVVVGFEGTSTANGGVTVLHAKAGVLSVGAAVPGAYRSVRAVGIAKLDQDAKNDLVVVDAGNSLGPSDKLHVLLHSATVGTFFAPTSSTIGKNGHGTDVGDIDGDGDLDVVVTTNGDPGAVHVFENNGSGVLAEPALSPFRVASDAQAVRIVDLQGDSDFDTPRIDVVVCHPSVHKITQLFAYRDGEFKGRRGNYTPLAPVSVAFGHADADGAADMFVASLGDDCVTVYLSVPDALGQTIGSGCPGTPGFEGAIPLIYPKDSLEPLPKVGNQGFAVALRNARPSADAVLLLTIREKFAPVACGLLVGRLIHWQVRQTDAGGDASIPVPIPNNPAFAGIDFYAQYLVIDPNGQLANNFAMSAGMRFRLGR